MRRTGVPMRDLRQGIGNADRSRTEIQSLVRSIRRVQTPALPVPSGPDKLFSEKDLQTIASGDENAGYRILLVRSTEVLKERDAKKKLERKGARGRRDSRRPSVESIQQNQAPRRPSVQRLTTRTEDEGRGKYSISKVVQLGDIGKMPTRNKVPSPFATKRQESVASDGFYKPPSHFSAAPSSLTKMSIEETPGMSRRRTRRGSEKKSSTSPYNRRGSGRSSTPYHPGSSERNDAYTRRGSGTLYVMSPDGRFKMRLLSEDGKSNEQEIEDEGPERDPRKKKGKKKKDEPRVVEAKFDPDMINWEEISALRDLYMDKKKKKFFDPNQFKTWRNGMKVPTWMFEYGYEEDDEKLRRLAHDRTPNYSKGAVVGGGFVRRATVEYLVNPNKSKGRPYSSSWGIEQSNKADLIIEQAASPSRFSQLPKMGPTPVVSKHSRVSTYTHASSGINTARSASASGWSARTSPRASSPDSFRSHRTGSRGGGTTDRSRQSHTRTSPKTPIRLDGSPKRGLVEQPKIALLDPKIDIDDVLGVEATGEDVYSPNKSKRWIDFGSEQSSTPAIREARRAKKEEEKGGLSQDDMAIAAALAAMIDPNSVPEELLPLHMRVDNSLRKRQRGRARSASPMMEENSALGPGMRRRSTASVLGEEAPTVPQDDSIQWNGLDSTGRVSVIVSGASILKIMFPKKRQRAMNLARQIIENKRTTVWEEMQGSIEEMLAKAKSTKFEKCLLHSVPNKDRMNFVTQTNVPENLSLLTMLDANEQYPHLKLIDASPQLKGFRPLTKIRHRPTKIKEMVLAIKENDENYFEKLLLEGAQVTAKTKAGDNLLHVCINHAGYKFAKSILFVDKSMLSEQNANGETPLHLAVARGAMRFVELFVQMGADLNILDKDGKRPIDIAEELLDTPISFYLIWMKCRVRESHVVAEICKHGYPEMLRVCIDRGILHDTPDTDQGKTPIFRAVEYGRVNCVRVLLENGARVDSRTLKQHTPLHFAVMCGHLEVARILIQHGARVNPRDDKGNRPLHLAVRKRHLAMVELLLHEGRASVDVCNFQRITPLMFADDSEMVDLLIAAGANINAQDRFNNTIMHHAIKRKNWEILSFLKMRGASFRMRNALQMTPLEYAFFKNDTFCVETLLKIDQSDRYHMTARIALFFDNLGFLEKLVGPGKMSTQDLVEMEALHLASRFNAHRAIKYLIETLKIDPNVQDSETTTPLMLAARLYSEETCKLLVSLGANPSIENEDSMVAVDVALDNDIHEDGEMPPYSLVEFLLTRTEITSLFQFNTMALCASKLDPEIVDLYVRVYRDLNLDLSRRDQKGRVPLNCAASGGCVPLIRCLVEDWGAGLQVSDENREGPLHKACESGSLDAVIYLLMKGADPNIHNSSGLTPVHKAILAKDAVCVNAVLRKTGDPDQRVLNRTRKTCLHLCADVDNDQACKVLLRFHSNPSLVTSTGADAYDYAVIKKAWKVAGAIYHVFGPTSTSIPQHNMIPASINDDLDYMHVVLDNGSVDINKLESVGSCSHIAVRNDSKDMLTLLVEKRADVTLKDENGHTPFELAVEMGSMRTLGILYNMASNDGVIDVTKPRLLEFAVKSNQGAVVGFLLDVGFSPEGMLQNGDSVLHLSVKLGFQLCTVRLASYAKDIDVRNSLGRTPFMEAVARGNIHLADTLLDFKPGINIHDNKRQTALHLAAIAGHMDLVWLLLTHGAKMNIRDIDGNTPLHLACEHGRVEVIDNLKYGHVRMYAKNYKGNTPLSIARKIKQPEVREYIVKRIEQFQASAQEREKQRQYVLQQFETRLFTRLPQALRFSMEDVEVPPLDMVKQDSTDASSIMDFKPAEEWQPVDPTESPSSAESGDMMWFPKKALAGLTKFKGERPSDMQVGAPTNQWGKIKTVVALSRAMQGTDAKAGKTPKTPGTALSSSAKKGLTKLKAIVALGGGRRKTSTDEVIPHNNVVLAPLNPGADTSTNVAAPGGLLQRRRQEPRHRRKASNVSISEDILPSVNASPRNYGKKATPLNSILASGVKRVQTPSAGDPHLGQALPGSFLIAK